MDIYTNRRLDVCKDERTNKPFSGGTGRQTHDLINEQNPCPCTFEGRPALTFKGIYKTSRELGSGHTLQTYPTSTHRGPHGCCTSAPTTSAAMDRDRLLSLLHGRRRCVGGEGHDSNSCSKRPESQKSVEQSSVS